MKRRNMHLGAKPSLFRNAYDLRKNTTEAEEILWSHLRERQMEGVKFRRQHPLKDYAPDFFANELKLAIELDGSYHNESVQRFYDKDWEEIITSYKIVVLRFINEDVIYNIEIVLSIIRDKIKVLRSLKKKKWRFSFYSKFTEYL
jgi:very-short-patch-repair endonuclease